MLKNWLPGIGEHAEDTRVGIKNFNCSLLFFSCLFKFSFSHLLISTSLSSSMTGMVLLKVYTVTVLLFIGTFPVSVNSPTAIQIMALPTHPDQTRQLFRPGQWRTGPQVEIQRYPSLHLAVPPHPNYLHIPRSPCMVYWGALTPIKSFTQARVESLWMMLSDEEVNDSYLILS